ncbi:MAG: DUF3592 domain-containing protein [Phycisphaerales bacterium]
MNPMRLTRAVVSMLVAIALGVVVWNVTDTVITQAVSSDWPRANGYVRHAQVVASDANPFIDDLELDYTYQIGTDWKVGDRLTFYGKNLSMLLRVGGSAETMAQEYANGTPIQVAYDPNNPRRAVLIPGITATEFGAAALLILGVGGVAIGMFTHGFSMLSGELNQNPPAGTISRDAPARMERAA